MCYLLNGNKKLMSSDELKLNTKKWFSIFCLLHVFIWTLAPTFVRSILPHDTVESIAWGMQWQLGYDKHPPLSAWAAAAFHYLSGGHDWGLYLAAQLAVVLSFWAVWQLAKKILNTVQALISVFLLEGIVYYTYFAVRFTPDTLQTPLWALLGLCFYWAIQSQELKHWLLVGFFSAAVIWTKYQSALLLILLFLFLLFEKNARKSFQRGGIYAAFILFLMLMTPHFIWSYFHHFPEVQYALYNKIDLLYHPPVHSFIARLMNVWIMLISQFAAMIIFILFLFTFFKTKRSEQIFASFDKKFISWISLSPLAATLIYGVVTGNALIARWATPYFSWLGILAMMCLKPVITRKVFARFFIIFILLSVLLCAGRYIGLIFGPKWIGDTNPDAYYPGKEIAVKVTTLWHQKFHQKLNIIAGSHYLAAYITVYSPDHPKPYFDWNHKESAWLNDSMIKQKGTMFAWDPEEDVMHVEKNLIPQIKKRFPRAEFLGFDEFNKNVIGIKPPTVKVGMMILAGEQSISVPLQVTKLTNNN